MLFEQTFSVQHFFIYSLMEPVTENEKENEK